MRLHVFVIVVGLILAGSPVLAQPFQQRDPIPVPNPTPGWDTKVSQPSDPNYVKPDYPMVFVRAPIVENTGSPVCRTLNGTFPFAGSINCSPDTSNCTGSNQEVIQEPKSGDYHLGADVVTASNPSVGNQLWIYLPSTGGVKKLFPRAVHEDQTHEGYIDFSRSVGSVVEPSLSEDGTKVYFAYFQDATKANSTQDNYHIPWSGADLYWIDISPLLSNPNANLNNLAAKRLTFRTYQGTTAKQAVADRDKEAMNIGVAGSTTIPANSYGTVHMHPTEFRTKDGLFLAYVSNKRRLDNSNAHMTRENHNFNIHVAPILPDGTLGPEDNQFQYYTTTSALSPTPLRKGLAFSYQATTEDARYWHIQKLDSEGRWEPLIGFGHGDQLYHFGSFCVSEESGDYKDYFVALKYYNVNNESFGSIWKQDLSILGVNTYDNSANHMYVPRQVGATELTQVPISSLSKDDPSPFNFNDDYYYGKFTTPRCGGVDELYFAYTPTSANGRLFDLECSKNVYRSHIGFRDDLGIWSPGETVANNGHYTVIKRTDDDFNLLWPVPVVPWVDRSNGDTTQQFTANSATKKRNDIVPGEPFALVGTSALYNTDRRPPECYLKQFAGSRRYYHPWGTQNVNQENDAIMSNQDTWTWVTQSGENDFCVTPPPSTILGIAVNVTSNKPNMGSADYRNLSNQPKEAAKLLGVYDVRAQGDQSFFATIPANVPFDFHALDSTYGMKLTDVRSWHSLKPREKRTNCGGCHQHEAGADFIPFGGTVAQQNPPLDMVRATPSISYDQDCDIQTDPPNNDATKPYPEWRADIWPKMDQYCGSCHNSTTGNGTGDDALSWSNTSQGQGDTVYGELIGRKFIDPRRGALGSQMFWAARGRRTDNRDNTDPQLAADYDCSGGCSDGKDQWGFFYSSAHDNLPVGCEDGNQEFADWVFDVGKWIDTHAPRNTGSPYDYQFDRFHPTADSALTGRSCEALSGLRIGWWDDTGFVQSVAVTKTSDGSPLYNSPPPPVANGRTNFSVSTLNASDSIRIEVIDQAGNRQVYYKTAQKLIDECNLPDPGPISTQVEEPYKLPLP